MRPTRSRAVRAGRSLNEALARLPQRRRGPARRRSPFMRCAGSARPRWCAARWRRRRRRRTSTRFCSPRSPCSGRPARRRMPSTRWSTRRLPRRPGARRTAPASSTRCCAASCASATRWSTLRLADPLARYNHPAWWLDRLRADWPERLAGDRRRRQPASADDLARQRAPQQRGRVRGRLAAARHRRAAPVAGAGGRARAGRCR